MNEETKELLDKLNNKAIHYILYDYEVKQLLDYITNLQEENKDLKVKLDMEKKISAYKDEVSKEDLNMAKDFMKFQEKTIEHLKEYL